MTDDQEKHGSGAWDVKTFSVQRSAFSTKSSDASTTLVLPGKLIGLGHERWLGGLRRDL